MLFDVAPCYWKTLCKIPRTQNSWRYESIVLTNRIAGKRMHIKKIKLYKYAHKIHSFLSDVVFVYCKINLNCNRLPIFYRQVYCITIQIKCAPIACGPSRLFHNPISKEFSCTVGYFWFTLSWFLNEKSTVLPKLSETAKVRLVCFQKNDFHFSMFLNVQAKYKTIRIFNGCGMWIKKSVTRVTVKHPEAFRLMPNSYPKCRHFQSSPNNHYRSFCVSFQSTVLLMLK